MPSFWQIRKESTRKPELITPINQNILYHKYTVQLQTLASSS